MYCTMANAANTELLGFMLVSAKSKSKGKGKVRPMKSQRLQQRCSLVLDLGGWSMTRPGRFTAGKMVMISIVQKIERALETR